MSELKLLQCRLDGRYDIEECLSHGSYAEIYVAHDRAAPDEQFRKVVIKALNVLLQGYQDPDLERTLIQNFQNEAIALDRVRHPNIISRLGHGTALDLTGTPFHYIVLEYLGGGDLAALARLEPLGLERAIFFLQQVSSGLAHAHECGVIHLDIKPQNLLLTDDQETVKIADFGVAKLEAADRAITRVGTNIYAAPEHNPLVQTSQLDTKSLSSEHLTPAADIYSLAKTAYTLFCGVSPRRFAHDPITELPANLSHEYWSGSVLRVLERATQRRPADRYQTVQEFWGELSDAMMPPTKPLHVEERPVSVPSDLSAPVAVIADAQPKPRFETSKELRHEAASNGGRPRIVVPISHKQPQVMPPPTSGPIQQSNRVTVAVPGAAAKVPAPTKTSTMSTRLRAVLVRGILILAFAGMLLATRNYIRTRWAQQTTQPTSIVGQEAVTTTDLNLRAGPSSANDQVGLAESGSRVRVLDINVNSTWCEVQVLQHSRTKSDPTSLDKGWVYKKYLKFD